MLPGYYSSCRYFYGVIFVSMHKTWSFPIIYSLIKKNSHITISQHNLMFSENVLWSAYLQHRAICVLCSSFWKLSVQHIPVRVFCKLIKTSGNLDTLSPQRVFLIESGSGFVEFEPGPSWMKTVLWVQWVQASAEVVHGVGITDHEKPETFREDKMLLVWPCLTDPFLVKVNFVFSTRTTSWTFNFCSASLPAHWSGKVLR